MRRCASFLFFAAVFVTTLVATSICAQVGAGAGQDTGEKTAGPEPEFKAEKYAKSFAEGREAFEKGDYKDAAKSFKSAARGAKSKSDKEIVARWSTACKGAPLLKQVEALQKRNYWNEAYDKLLTAAPRYRATPIEPAFRKSIADLERVLFYPIETFDRPNPRLYSKKYGKTFIQDQKLLANGTVCLHWQNTKDGKPGVLKIRSIPVDWSGYQALEFWVNTRVPAKAEVLLMSTPGKKKNAKPGAGKTRAGQTIVPMLMQPLVLPRRGGWQYVRVKLADFKPQGDADLSRVTDLRFQFPGGKSFDFFIDDIRLRKKNPAKTKASGAKPRR